MLLFYILCPEINIKIIHTQKAIFKKMKTLLSRDKTTKQNHTSAPDNSVELSNREFKTALKICWKIWTTCINRKGVLAERWRL